MPLAVTIKEKVCYATDMYSPANGNATQALDGLSPVWQFSPGADESVYMDFMIPVDRVPGTDIALWPVYYGGGVGGAQYALRLSYTITGEGEPVIVLAPTTKYVHPPSPNYPLQAHTGVRIYAAEVDGRNVGPRGLWPVNIQLQLTRLGTSGDDWDANNLNLLKVVMLYAAYVDGRASLRGFRHLSPLAVTY